MKLVDDWQNVLKWWSVWGGVAVAVLSAIQMALPDLKDALPAHTFAGLTFALGLAIPILRVTKQGTA